jgi:hypothetical protein
MVPKAVAPPTEKSLESDARRLAGILEKHKSLLLLLLTAIYAFGAILHARSKPLWYDEIITTFAAKAPNAVDTWKIAGQTDVNPPLPHLMIHFAMRWVTPIEIGARLPAIIGFWIFCLCMYRFTRVRVGIYYALAALLLPVVTDAYTYSAEARAYGPELAFCGLALVAWQAAAEDSRRIWALVGLAVSLAGATLCHYYAILLYVPLLAGELFRWYRGRKFDWRIWAAFAAGGAGLASRVPILLQSVKSSVHSWAQPYPAQILEFWDDGLHHAPTFAVLFIALLALFVVASRGDRGIETPIVLVDHELIAGVLFLTIPLLAVLGALLVTHMYAPRYALPGLTGVALLIPMLAAYISRGRALFGFVITVVLLSALSMLMVGSGDPPNPFLGEPVLVKAAEKEPVAIADGLMFLQMWQYAPPALKPHILYLADGEAALKYTGATTIDEGLLTARRFTSAGIVEYKTFATPGKEFLVFQNTPRPGWLLRKVLDDRYPTTLEDYDAYRVLVRVRVK